MPFPFLVSGLGSTIPPFSFPWRRPAPRPGSSPAQRKQGGLLGGFAFGTSLSVVKRFPPGAYPTWVSSARSPRGRVAGGCTDRVTSDARHPERATVLPCSIAGPRGACLRQRVMLRYGVRKNRAPFDPE